MERPAPIIGVNFCKREEHEWCVEGPGGLQEIHLQRDGMAWIAHIWAKERESWQVGHHCTVFVSLTWQNFYDAQRFTYETTRMYRHDGTLVVIKAYGCAAWAVWLEEITL